MADLYPVAGATISIGGVLPSQSTDFIASDFSTEVWVAIDGWETMGALGDTAESIATNLINRGRVVKQKGTFDAGDMENTFAILPTDVGQIALLAAKEVKSSYAFKIEFDDAPPAGTPTTLYFIAIVMSAAEQGGGANTVRMLSATLAINSNIVTVAAA